MLMNLYPFSKNNKDRSVPTDLYLSKKLNSFTFFKLYPLNPQNGSFIPHFLKKNFLPIFSENLLRCDLFPKIKSYPDSIEFLNFFTSDAICSPSASNVIKYLS